MGKNTAKSLVKELEKIKSTVSIYEISAEQENLHLLESYVEEHNKIAKGEKDADKDASGNFNEYLQKKLKDEPEYAGKLVIAEITGDIGVNPHHRGIDEEYDAELKRDIGISLEGADLSGSRLVEVNVFKSLKNVNLRDCFFEDVFFDGCSLSGVDLRGTKLKNCEFEGYGMEDGLEGGHLESLHLDIADPLSAQTSDLFRIEEYPEERTQEETKIRREVENERDEAISQFKKKKTAEQGWGAWATSFVSTTEEQKKFNEELSRGTKEIEKKFEAYLATRLRINANKYIIPLPTAQCDPTYIPRDIERAAAKKILLEATAQELKEYSQIRPSQESFNEFIAKKPQNQEILAKAKAANPGIDIIPTADFFFENKKYQTIDELDLSDLDLSGVKFSRVRFKNCNFNKSNLTGSCFEGAAFKESASFVGAILTDSNFIDAVGEMVDFSGAFMPRVRMMCSTFEKSNFGKALLHSADLTGSNIEGASIRNADMRDADLEKVNMRYVDAQYVKMRSANLKGAILDGGDFSHADLTNAVMDDISARETNFRKAVLEDARIQYADLRNAILEEINAKGADLTGADLEQAHLKLANLSNAIMDSVNAKLADFTEATLRDAHAHQANFSRAVMEKIDGERLDISESILTETNLRNANLSKAVMKKVEAYKADFRKATLDGVNAEFATMIACDFEEAKLRRANIQGAILNMSHMNQADCTGVEFDEKTLLLDVNFSDAIGAEALIELQKEQHKLNSQLFGRSKYGPCKNNGDGSNDRFNCQRIGAALLSSVIGGTAGYALSGPFTGVAGAAVLGLINDRALVAIKDGYFHEQGYISNQLGDKLAELGAIAIATGAASLEEGVDSIPVAIALCTASGLISPGSIALTAGGTLATYAGIQSLETGFKEENTVKKALGAILTTLGAAATAVGITSLVTGVNTFTGLILCGAAWGGIEGGTFAYNQLKDFDADNKTGMRPEEIYQISMQKFSDVYKKIWPTWNKFICAAVYAILGVALALLIANPVSALGFSVAASLSFGLGTFGLCCGYLFDQNLSFWHHPIVQDTLGYFQNTPASNIQIETPQKSKEMNREPEIEMATISELNTKQHKSIREIDIDKTLESAPDTTKDKVVTTVVDVSERPSFAQKVMQDRETTERTVEITKDEIRPPGTDASERPTLSQRVMDERVSDKESGIGLI